MQRSIAIVGAGIGGLTVALALARVGCSVTVIERRTGFSEVGAGLQLSPNASRLLISMGLGPALQRAATEPDRVVIRSTTSGAQIGEIALGKFMRDSFDAPYWVVHRADLQTILLDAARAEASIQLMVGRTVGSVLQNADGVRLATTSAGNAHETIDAELVVGADGVGSTLRKAIGDERQAIYRGYVAWRTTVDRSNSPASLTGNETGLWLGSKGHVVHYPIQGGKRINVVAVQKRKQPVEGWSAPGNVSELLTGFGRMAPDLRALISQESEWLLWSLADLPAKSMAEGRIALLGDAAHPVLPFLAQGAALAIEDAVCLVRELTASEDNIPAALVRYNEKRIGRAVEVQSQGRRNGHVYHAAGPLAFIRDHIIRRRGATGMVDRYNWLYGYRLDGGS